MILHVIGAEHAGGHRLHLWFNDDTNGDVDLSGLLTGPIYQPLQSLDYFKRFRLEGHTVAWENGADFAPEYLQGLILSQATA